MSMLTPLGTGGRSRRSRTWPKVLAVLLALLAVGAAAYGAWRWLERDSEPDGAAATPTTLCRTPTVARPDHVLRPNQVTVSVANGTDQPGLALDTADALAARGFTVDGIGNTERAVEQGVAQVRYEPKDLDAAITVAAYVPGSQLQPVEKAAVPALWLGPDFPGPEQGVVRANDANPASVELPLKDPVCHTSRQS
ncbi:MAG TPA: LytR C-terminal domain-containing protein [Actinomycetes bacterium]|nr:LytR C-terminal domain-containing protein [Actinomycetes bacterium]